MFHCLKLYCVTVYLYIRNRTPSHCQSTPPDSLSALSTVRMSGQVGKVFKSYQEEDPVKNYCLANSTPRHPVQLKLMQETMKLERVRLYLAKIKKNNQLIITAEPNVGGSRGLGSEQPAGPKSGSQEGVGCWSLHWGQRSRCSTGSP